ncbi:GntR family transcriptional regulator [Pseudooceanicola algae]|uniref:HTH-type transcriptional repressor GlaR n=1 Tax=Pseudooceanicola algae TaxID=1537215 RepID=A0A418SFF9_9RHOB|nr:GntR family transcriptional regulator [Pseudooceanicola algae]QPM89173.1 HTH-type transcriptional repressor GlaR [Pseudooceanicola algae]
MAKDNTQVTTLVQRLGSMIIAGDFRPGERLLEDTLTEEMGLGRTPLREALLVLQGQGMIDRRKGWYVPETRPAEVPNLFEARAVAEEALAVLATRRGGPDLAVQLEQLCDRMETYPDISRAELNALNQTFHEAIRDAAANPHIAEFWDRAQFRHWQLRLPIMFSQDQILMAHTEHRRIADAVSAGQADAAGAAARAHVEATARIVTEALETVRM